MRAALVYDEALTAYNLGASHPLKPERLRLTRALIQATCPPNGACRELPPRLATEDDLLPVHSADYLAEVRRLSVSPRSAPRPGYGFEVADNPPFPGMWEASLRYTGASLAAAELVLSGQAQVAFSIAGGLHHAMRSRASGFCIFNDCAVAIYRLLREVDRVAYVDVDAHHGDGVQAAFYSDPRVLTISIHESGRYLFPGTGFPEEVGEGAGVGFSVNVPLPPATGDDAYQLVFDGVIVPLLKAFRPDVIVTQLGADSHLSDPLAHLCVTTHTYEHVLASFASFGLPWVALGGGGYNLQAVPRVWALAWAAMCGCDVPDAMPRSQLAHYGTEAIRDPVRTASEAKVTEAVAAVIDRVKELVFPTHGL